MNPLVSNSAAPLRGRLAPSPTGHLHLGNAWSFLICWLAVRSAGGKMVLRMEDIDPERSRPHFAGDIMRDLAWLGLDWDEGPDVGGQFKPYTQSEKLERYAEVIDRLTSMGRTYPCYCTRKELKTMASAPHLEDVGPVYPGTCLGLEAAERKAREAQGRRPTLRLHGGEDVEFSDLVFGKIRMGWSECGGDFPLRRSDGVISYQLAVAVDDMDQHISLVVRGADILPCTPRQMLLFRLLGASAPRYAHVPLLLDHEGARLAKRHRSCELRLLRESGVTPQAVTGYLAWHAGMLPENAAAQPEELLGSFAWEKLPRDPVKLGRGFMEDLLLLS
jgi:glutamyl-tRNA synthetase